LEKERRRNLFWIGRKPRDIYSKRGLIKTVLSVEIRDIGGLPRGSFPSNMDISIQRDRTGKNIVEHGRTLGKESIIRGSLDQRQA